MTTTEKRTNLRIAAVAAFFGGLASSATQTIWQPFVLSFGLPVSMVGFLETLGSFKGIVTSLLYPISGWLADKRGRKPIMVTGALSVTLAFGLYLLAGITGAGWLLFPGVICLGIAFAADPAFNAFVAESAHASRRGAAFSAIMVASTTPVIFLSILGGLAVDRWGFTPIYALTAALLGIRLILIAGGIRETLTTVTRTGLSVPVYEVLRSLVPPKRLRGFYLATAFDSFVWGLGFHLLFAMLRVEHGFTAFQFGMMICTRALVVALTQMPMGRIVDRYGYKAMLVASEVVGFVVLVGLLFSESFLAFVFFHALFGLSISTWVPAQLSLQANSVPEHERGRTMGGLAAFRGLIGASGPLVGGLIYDHYGYHAAILANLVGLLVPLALFIFAVKNAPPAEEARPG